MANTLRNRAAQGGAERSGKRVLVGDDDPAVCDVLASVLNEEHYTVVTATRGDQVMEQLSQRGAARPDIALVDVRMPDMDGMAILQRIQEQGIDVPVILMTGYSTGSLTIKAMQMGAADYLIKPLELDEVLETVARVLRDEELKRGDGDSLAPTIKTEASERIVGSSPEMTRIFKTIGRVARTQATVLVTGETGTGKELMAEAIHNASDRRRGPLIKVNCAALPETLLESELFGHEKGSFTNALTQHKGRFEVADKGTIFLDEVGEMTLGTQKKLLRVLQEREFERVGGTVPVKVDVRVIAATNRNLQDEVAAGRFREDLYYRLNVIAMNMPPLRRRMQDIPALAQHFLNKHRYTPSSAPSRMTEEALQVLMTHEWPGNVRELENIVQRAVVFSRGSIITPEHIIFPEETKHYVLNVHEAIEGGATLEEMLNDVRREAVATVLLQTGQDYSKSAKILNISEEEFLEYVRQFEFVGEAEEEAPARELAARLPHE